MPNNTCNKGQTLPAVAKQVGININANKTKVMKVNSKIKEAIHSDDVAVDVPHPMHSFEIRL
jgi:hypothetical protein